MALYHKYRPQKFDDLVGQDHIKKILSQALASEKTSHGYLFAGPRGTGKTTTARLLAKALNCMAKSQAICDKCGSCLAISKGLSLDVIEIDAASNRGIDDVRELREKIKFAPSGGRYKVFIIDEVHMLTKEAFNALLKTLEEPPAHAIFILATTEPHKVPATIISRTQRFDFKRPTSDVLANWLSSVAKQEKFKIDQQALQLVAALADGSFRDALTLLEQVATGDAKITRQVVEQSLGLVSQQAIAQLIASIEDCDLQNFLKKIDEFYQNGVDFGFLYKQFILTLRDQMINEGKLNLAELIQGLIEAQARQKLSPLPQLPLELAVVGWCQLTDVNNNQQLTINNQQSTPYSGPAGRPAFELTANKWDEIVKAVKQYNHSLAGILQEGKVAQDADGTVKLAVKFAFHKDRIDEPKNHRQIADAVKQIIGQDAVLVCEVDDDLPINLAQTNIYETAKDVFGAI